MIQFSTNESVSLEKEIEHYTKVLKTPLNLINFAYEIEKCAKWILDNDFQKVCLQFPDYLLPDAAPVVLDLEEKIENKVYILGDTAYGSCCIDYTAAEHISADAIIHFGPTCFSKSQNNIPCLKIYQKDALDIKEFCVKLRNKFTDDSTQLLILINTPYLHKIEEIRECLNEFQIKSIEDELQFGDLTVLYVGEEDRKLMNINLTYNPKQCYFYDPNVREIQLYGQDTRILKRRYYLMEKIKDSTTIGIVISTLAVKNYLKIIERVKLLSKIHGKKSYIISVGKPTVAKLANFPEINVFVIVGCAMNEIYEVRDYYAPLVTPYDLEAALNPPVLENTQFSYDFNKILLGNPEIDPALIEALKTSDISLLTGQIRYQEDNQIDTVDNPAETQVAVRPEGIVQINDTSGAGYLASRSWKGLEQHLGGTEPQLAEEGRQGTASCYKNEIE